MTFEEINIGDSDKIKLCVGSHHQIRIEKLFGPTVAEDIDIFWEKDDWNIITKQRVKEEFDEMMQDIKKGMPPFQVLINSIKELGL